MARRVYSTGPDGVVDLAAERCGRCAAQPCRCAERSPAVARGSGLRVRRERGGRRGKTVTVVEPLQMSRSDALDLLARLKRRCGAGGTLRSAAADGPSGAYCIEIQGDHADRLLVELARQGLQPRRAGG